MARTYKNINCKMWKGGECQPRFSAIAQSEGNIDIFQQIRAERIFTDFTERIIEGCTLGKIY